jgi:hypothetical protein
MKFNHDHLQQNRQYSAPEKLIHLNYASLTLIVVERNIANVRCRNSHAHKHDY